VRILITILLLLSCLYPFSRLPKWIVPKKDYPVELINIGDLDLKIDSLYLAKGIYADIESQFYTIKPDETLTVILKAKKCIDTLIVKSNSVPDSIKKVLFKYNKLIVL